MLEDSQFRALCGVLDLEHVAKDPELVTGGQRVRFLGETSEVFQAVFMTRPSDEWVVQMKAAGVPGSLVMSREACDGPQTTANQMFYRQGHPVIGEVTMVAPPFHLSNSREESGYDAQVRGWASTPTRFCTNSAATKRLSPGFTNGVSSANAD